MTLPFASSPSAEAASLKLPALPCPGDTPGAHYLRTGTSRWAGEGFAEDLQELWSEEGELLAQCRQCIAVLG